MDLSDDWCDKFLKSALTASSLCSKEKNCEPLMWWGLCETQELMYSDAFNPCYLRWQGADQGMGKLTVLLEMLLLGIRK